MPNWTDLFGDLLAVQVAAWIAAFFLLLVLIVKVWPWIRGLVRLVDNLQSLPAFMERTDQELKSQTEKISEIHHEVNYNNGGSVKDAVSRLDANVTELIERVGAAELTIRGEAELTIKEKGSPQ